MDCSGTVPKGTIPSGKVFAKVPYTPSSSLELVTLYKLIKIWATDTLVATAVELEGVLRKTIGRFWMKIRKVIKVHQDAHPI